MKKVLTIVLTIALLICCVPVGAFAVEPGSFGISSAQGLKNAIESDLDGKFHLTQDIDFGGMEIVNSFISDRFSGTLDGNGYSLLNFTLKDDGTTKTDTGFFKYITDEADTTIKNLTLGSPTAPIVVNLTNPGSANGVLAAASDSKTNKLIMSNVHAYVDINATIAGNAQIGGLFGCTMDCEITDCTVTGTIDAESSTSGSWMNVAGFTGNPKRLIGTYTNCKSYVDITVKENTTVRAGGIAAYVDATKTDPQGNPYVGGIKLENCVNYGDIKCVDVDGLTAGEAMFGGLVGMAVVKNTAINGCFNYGDVSSVKHAAAIAGSSKFDDEASYITNCANFGKITTSADVAPGLAYAASEKGTVAANNVDFSESMKESTSANVKVAGVQNTAVAEGLYKVRFVGTVDSLDYKSVGFEVKLTYGAKNELKIKENIGTETSTVYSEIVGKEGATTSAADLGGTYAFTMTIDRVPTTAADGIVTFVITPFAKNASETVYGTSAVCTYSDGVLVGIEALS